MDKGIDDLDNAIEDIYGKMFYKDNIVQSDTVGGTDKVASAEVAKLHGQKLAAKVNSGYVAASVTVTAGVSQNNITSALTSAGYTTAKIKGVIPVLNAVSSSWDVGTGATTDGTNWYAIINSATAQTVTLFLYIFYID